MEVELLEMPQEEAQKQVEALKEAFKRNKHIKQQEIYTDMRKVYGHMQHGGKIIDIYAAFKSTGLNELGEPKLAICRADATKCYVFRHDNGSAVFSMKPETRSWITQDVRKSYNDIGVPRETFTWHLKDPNKPRDRWNQKTATLSTIVPIIPAPILVDEVKHNLNNYHILWEVDEWKPEPPRDPILLKQITENLFGVLATWDLTDLERAILKAHITRSEVP